MQDNDDSTPESVSHGTEKNPRDGRGHHPNSRRNLIPFKKGGDPRANHKGRPKTFDQFRALAQKIAGQAIEDKDGNAITIGEFILRSWVESKEPALQRAFVEYAFGKVPDKPDAAGLENKTTLILHYGHERELKRLENESDTTS
jgi:hypothetical protein